MLGKLSYFWSASVAALASVPVILGCALLGATGARAVTCTADAAACTPFVVTIDQEGNNVVAMGSGEFNTTPGLNFPTNTGAAAQVNPSTANLVLGGTSPPIAGQNQRFLFSFTQPGPPVNFGSGGQVFPNSVGGTPTAISQAVGDLGPANVGGFFGFVQGSLFLPRNLNGVLGNYVSGTDFTSSATWDNTTLAALGISSTGGNVAPNVYRWTWGNFNEGASFADQSFTIDVVSAPNEIPLPATLPLFASGLGAMGLLGWRRKRRAQTVA